MTESELRDLDCKIHCLVFNESAVWGNDCSEWIGEWSRNSVPHYSTSIFDAWKVVEKLTERQYVLVRTSTSHWHGDYCSIYPADSSQREEGDPIRFDALNVWGETMQVAICLAAIKAIQGAL